jgi:hypothetical protein
MKQFDIGKAFSFAFKTIKKYPLLLLGPIIFFNFLFQTFSYFWGENPGKINYIEKSKFFQQLPQTIPVYGRIIVMVIILLVIASAVIIAITIEIGRMKIAFHVFDEKEDYLTWNVYRNFEKGMIGRYFLTLSLLALILLVGYVFLIVPGIILSLMYQFVLLILVEKQTKIIESFKISYRLTNGIKSSIFGYTILAGLISILFVLPPVILQYFKLHHYALFFSIFITPTVSLFFSLGMIYIYKEISSQDENLEKLIAESNNKAEKALSPAELI